VTEDEKCETHDYPRGGGGGLEIPKMASCVRRISSDKPTITYQKTECSVRILPLLLFSKIGMAETTCFLSYVFSYS
jgi:hypothetical protein